MLNGEPSSRPVGDAATARAMSGITFHTGHHRTDHRQIDLVVTTVQHLIGICQHKLAMRAGYRHCGPGCPGVVQYACLSPAGSASDPSMAAGWNCPGFSTAHRALLQVRQSAARLPQGAAIAPE